MIKNLVRYFIFLFFPGRCTNCASSKFTMQKIEQYVGYVFCRKCGSLQDYMDYSNWWTQNYGKTIWDRFEMVSLDQSIDEDLIL